MTFEWLFVIKNDWKRNECIKLKKELWEKRLSEGQTWSLDFKFCFWIWYVWFLDMQQDLVERNNSSLFLSVKIWKTIEVLAFVHSKWLNLSTNSVHYPMAEVGCVNSELFQSLGIRHNFWFVLLSCRPKNTPIN